MVSSFNIDKLNQLLRDFHGITGMRITIFDEDCGEITAYPREVAPICQYIRTDPEALKTCHSCDMHACYEARKRRSPYIYRCHAGLTEAVAPVYMGNVVAAYLLFGHLFSYDDVDDGRKTICNSCGKYNLDDRKLAELVNSLSATSEDLILSAAHILQAVASYLCMDRLITLRQQGILFQIDSFISEHFAEDIDAGYLCEHFGIGRTQLYKLSKQNYGVGIAERIRSLRIDYAKSLLSDHPDLPINIVAEECGFHDYNYFISVFKRLTGTTPKKYRRFSKSELM